MTQPARRRGAERGFALLIVLWTMALLAFLGTQITSMGRNAAQLSQNLRRAAAVEAAADGALHATIFHLLDHSEGRWPADGAPHRIALASATAETRAVDEAGKVNPNSATLPMLDALLRAVGVDREAATQLAGSIAIWRSPDQQGLAGANTAQYRQAGRPYGPPSAPFQTVDELGLVLGMTPAILDRLRPHVSVYNQGLLSRTAADPVVREAMQTALGNIPLPEPGPDEIPHVVTIVATATDGVVRFTRRAVVELQLSPEGRPYSILSWESPPA